MKYNIYAIKDTKVGFMQPFIQPNDDVAIREFKTMVNSDKTSVGVNYSDMELYKLGEYFMDNGEIVSVVSFLINGINCRKVEQNDL